MSASRDFLGQAAEVARELAESSAAEGAEKAGELMAESLKQDGKIMFCGNGGSAADSQHLAAEFTGHLIQERAPLAGLALTTDTSAITAIANDYSYEDIFDRQVRGVGRAGDVLVCITTSGKSANIIKAAQAAKSLDIKVVALVGPSPCPLDEIADVTIHAPGKTTGLIQQGHITLGHLLCAIAEKSFLPS